MQIARAEDYIRLEHLVDGEGLDLEEQLEEIKKGQRPVGADQPKLRVCHLYGPSSFDPKHVSICSVRCLTRSNFANPLLLNAAPFIQVRRAATSARLHVAPREMQETVEASGGHQAEARAPADAARAAASEPT